jgi:hypothetical protein
MYEPEFIETAARAGSDWSVLTDILLPVVVGLIIACLSWLFGWTGRERRQDRDNAAIIEGVYLYILHFSAAARAAFPDALHPAQRLVEAIDAELGSLLVVCGGVSGRTKSIREALDLTRPLPPAKPEPSRGAAPKIRLEEGHMLVAADDCAPAGVRERYLIKADPCPAPAREIDLARDRRARLLDAVDDFHVYWSNRPARVAELRRVQHRLTEVPPPAIPHGHASKASHSAH